MGAGGLGEPDVVGEARGAALELRDPVLERRALLRRGGERLRERGFRGRARGALGLQVGRERSALRPQGLELLPQCAVGRLGGREARLRGRAGLALRHQLRLERGTGGPLGREVGAGGVELLGERVGEARGVPVALDGQGVALGLAGEPLGGQRGREVVALGRHLAGGGAALAGAVELRLERRAGHGLHAQARLGVRGHGLGRGHPGLGALQRRLERGDAGAERRGPRRGALALGRELGLRGLERVGARLRGLQPAAQLRADLLVDGLLAAPAALELLARRLRRGQRRREPAVGLLAGALELRAARLGLAPRELAAPSPARPRTASSSAARARSASSSCVRAFSAPRGPSAPSARSASSTARRTASPECAISPVRRPSRHSRDCARSRASESSALGERGLAALREPRELVGRRAGRGRQQRARGAGAGDRRGLGGLQRFALRRRLREPPLELGRLQLERLDRLQRLGRDARLGLLGRLGAPRAALGEHRAVDHLAAGLLRGCLDGCGRRRREPGAGAGRPERTPPGHSTHSASGAAATSATGTR